jgi:hypothetical protein
LVKLAVGGWATVVVVVVLGTVVVVVVLGTVVVVVVFGTVVVVVVLGTVVVVGGGDELEIDASLENGPAPAASTACTL